MTTPSSSSEEFSGSNEDFALKKEAILPKPGFILILKFNQVCPAASDRPTMSHTASNAGHGLNTAPDDGLGLQQGPDVALGLQQAIDVSLGLQQGPDVAAGLPLQQAADA